MVRSGIEGDRRSLAMFSLAAVITLCALTAFTASATTSVVFLLRELDRSKTREQKLAGELEEQRAKTLSESKSAQLDLRAVASDHVALEKERIESRRLARQSPIVVQLHAGGEEEAA
jgi:hypothetical protein